HDCQPKKPATPVNNNKNTVFARSGQLERSPTQYRENRNKQNDTETTTGESRRRRIQPMPITRPAVSLASRTTQGSSREASLCARTPIIASLARAPKTNCSVNSARKPLNLDKLRSISGTFTSALNTFLSHSLYTLRGGISLSGS